MSTSAIGLKTQMAQKPAIAAGLILLQGSMQATEEVRAVLLLLSAIRVFAFNFKKKRHHCRFCFELLNKNPTGNDGIDISISR
jgi:hypothetical protein